MDTTNYQHGVTSSPDLDVGRVCQQGLKTPCVALTNSPMSAEGPRLQQAREGGGGTLEVLREAQWGQLVLCKVFMGTSAETTGDRWVWCGPMWVWVSWNGGLESLMLSGAGDFMHCCSWSD